MPVLHGSDATLNGSGIDEEFGEDQESQEKAENYSDLFDAPNLADFITLHPSSNAKKYEKRVASMMKAGMVWSLNNDQFPDAATFLKHGPGFATAAGNLADVDARAAKIVDMLTAPESPYVMFMLVALPMVSQLIRNHQSDIEAVGRTAKERRAARKEAKKAGLRTKVETQPITIRFFKREIKLPIRLRFKIPKLSHVFKAFMSPTENPQMLAYEVFSDPAVQKALRKMGAYPSPGGGENEN